MKPVLHKNENQYKVPPSQENNTKLRPNKIQKPIQVILNKLNLDRKEKDIANLITIFLSVYNNWLQLNYDIHHRLLKLFWGIPAILNKKTLIMHHQPLKQLQKMQTNT